MPPVTADNNVPSYRHLFAVFRYVILLSKTSQIQSIIPNDRGPIDSYLDTLSPSISNLHRCHHRWKKNSRETSTRALLGLNYYFIPYPILEAQKGGILHARSRHDIYAMGIGIY